MLEPVRTEESEALGGRWQSRFDERSPPFPAVLAKDWAMATTCKMQAGWDCFYLEWS